MEKMFLFGSIAVLTLITSCSKKPIEATPIDGMQPQLTGIVYSLPRTIIKVKANVIKTVYTPGPYAAYAQKYLGISGVSTQRLEEYSIVNVDIDYALESDPSALYSVFFEDKRLLDIFKFTDAGLIIPVSKFSFESSVSTNIQKRKPDVSFLDLSSEPFIAEEKSTFYSKVQRDSSFVRVPVEKSMIIEKNLEEKAKEASDFIFSLRKKRIEFLTVDVDHPFDGVGIKVLLEEIDKMENEYLSLFIGKSFAEEESKCIDFTPTKPSGESSIVFRFSTSKGIVSSNNLSGNPILIELEPESVPESYKDFFDSIILTSNKSKFDQLYYRIPLNTTIRILDGKNELSSRRIPIYQYGPNSKFPAILLTH